MKEEILVHILYFFIGFAGKMLYEATCEQRDIHFALMKGGDAQGENTQPVEKGFFKLPIFYRGQKVFFSGGEDPDVDGCGLCISWFYEFIGEKRLEEALLHGIVQVANVSEEEAALACFFQRSCFVFRDARVGAGFAAE
jgi:hypothetical protein